MLISIYTIDMINTRRQKGSGCGCSMGKMFGGYRATRKNRVLLRRFRQGQSIGFTAVASLKAKGLLARTSKQFRGKRVIGPKYK
jgi:hypothetical protein